MGVARNSESSAGRRAVCGGASGAWIGTTGPRRDDPAQQAVPRSGLGTGLAGHRCAALRETHESLYRQHEE